MVSNYTLRGNNKKEKENKEKQVPLRERYMYVCMCNYLKVYFICQNVHVVKLNNEV